MSDWNVEEPHAWATVLGMVAIPMFGMARTRPLCGNCEVLLDGDTASFALTSGDTNRLLRESEPLDWSWSSNLTQTLIVDRRKGKFFVRRWDEPDNLQEHNLPSKQQAPEILELLTTAGQPKGKTVIEGMLHLFRVVRTNVVDHLAGTPADVLETFNALLVGTDAARRGAISAQEWTRATRLRDVLHMIESRQLAAPSPSTVSESVQDFMVGELIQALYDRDPDTRYYLNPDLLIRHAAGELFQEAHAELIQPAIRQQLLFPAVDPSRAKGKLKSDAHYTPPALARSLVQEAVAALHSVRGVLPSRIEALDPACGSGVFLIEALREIAFGWGHELALRGFDISQIACRMTEFCLGRVTQDDAGGHVPVSVAVAKQDSLALDFSWGKPDLILMNPPFVAWEKMPPHERSLVRQVLGDTYSYRPDKALAFLRKAIHSLQPGTVLATLVPAPLLEGRSGLKLRAAIESDETLAIHLLGQFRGFSYFHDATVEPAFLVISRGAKRQRQGPVRVATAEEGSEDKALRELRKRLPEGAWDPEGKWEVFQASREDFSASSWTPRSRRVLRLIEDLAGKGMSRVGDLFQVKLGIRTGENPVFLLSEAQLDALNPSKRERKLFRPVAQNDTIRDGRILSGVYLFYPYDSERKPLFHAEQELESAAPEYYRQYLVPNKDLLARRGGAQSRNWWELLRPRTNWQAKPVPKIVSAVFADSGSFAYDERGVFCVVQGLGWLWKRPRFHGSDLPWAYLALLNSRAFESFLAQFCRRVGGGQFDLYPAFVNRVFLPDLSDQSRVPEKLLNELSSLGQRLGNGEPISLDRLDEVVAHAYGVSLADLRHETPLAAPRPSSTGKPDASPDELQRRFRRLVQVWQKETNHLSSVARMAAHPAYREIVEMGAQAVPLLLAELRRRPDFWFAALREITKENPVPPESAGKVKEMAKAWIEWGKSKGHIE